MERAVTRVETGRDPSRCRRTIWGCSDQKLGSFRARARHTRARAKAGASHRRVRARAHRRGRGRAARRAFAGWPAGCAWGGAREPPVNTLGLARSAGCFGAASRRAKPKGVARGRDV